MAILHDFECVCGKVFERAVRMGEDRSKCECGEYATIAYLPKRRRQLSEPIVFYKCADGKYSFPGQHDAPPPGDAVERIECRTIQDYDKAMGRVNRETEGDARNRAEKMEQANAMFREAYRSQLRTRLANEQDNFARDLIRQALEEKGTDYERPRYSRTYSEAMDYYASNRDGEWRRGERERK